MISKGLIKSIQSGSINGTNTATITAVNTAKSIVLHQGTTQTYGTESGGYGGRLELTNATTVTATIVSPSGTMITNFTVVEFN